MNQTDELPDSLFQAIVKTGVTKVCRGGKSASSFADDKFNVNSWCRDKATHVYGAKFPETPFPDVQEEATEAFAAECERFMKLLGSSGKA